MALWNSENLNFWLKECQNKAAIDKVFRKKLLANPLETIEEFSQIPIPRGICLKIIESDPEYDYTFVLEPLRSKKISDDECSEIIGGASCNDFTAPYGCGQFTVCGTDRRK